MYVVFGFFRRFVTFHRALRHTRRTSTYFSGEPKVLKIKDVVNEYIFGFSVRGVELENVSFSKNSIYFTQKYEKIAPPKKTFFPRVSGRNEHGDPTLIFDGGFKYAISIFVAVRENAAGHFAPK